MDIDRSIKLIWLFLWYLCTVYTYLGLQKYKDFCILAGLPKSAAPWASCIPQHWKWINESWVLLSDGTGISRSGGLLSGLPVLLPGNPVCCPKLCLATLWTGTDVHKQGRHRECECFFIEILMLWKFVFWYFALLFYNTRTVKKSSVAHCKILTLAV